MHGEKLNHKWLGSGSNVKPHRLQNTLLGNPPTIAGSEKHNQRDLQITKGSLELRLGRSSSREYRSSCAFWEWRLRQWDGATGKRASHRLSWRASRPLSSCAGCAVVSRTVGNFGHLGRWVGGLIIVSVSQDNPNYVSQEQLGRVSVCSEDETAGEGDGKPSKNHKTEFPPPPSTPPSPSRARTRSRHQPGGDLREQTGGQTVTFCFFIRPRSEHSLPMSVTHWLTHSLTH